MKKEIKIGLTIIAGILMIYVILTWVKSMHLFAASRNNYTLRFDDVTGLKEGDPVNVFGYPSGNVESISLDQTGAIVRINLNQDIEVRSDATAEIRVKELMGGKMIELTPGQAGKKVGADDAIKGRISLDFSSAFAKAGEFLDLFDPQQIDDLMDDISTVADAFARFSKEIDSMDTGGMLHNVESSMQSLDNILSSVEQRRLVEDLDASLANVNQLAGKAETTLDAVTSLTNKVSDKTLPEMDKLVAQALKMLTESEDMITTLRDLMKQMQNQSTVAGKFLYDPEFANEMDHTIDNLNTTLDHIRTKKIYVVLSLGKKQKKFEEAVEGK